VLKTFVQDALYFLSWFYLLFVVYLVLYLSIFTNLLLNTGDLRRFTAWMRRYVLAQSTSHGSQD